MKMISSARAFSLVVRLLIFCIVMLIFSTSMVDGSATMVARGNETDRLALLSIKAQITDDPYGVTRSWNESVHFCQWQGVSCGRRHRRVTRLSLPSRRLTGYLSPSIGNLSFLRVIDLSDNSFEGEEALLEFRKLFRLQELFLPNNSFGGRIPTSLSNCSKLRIVDFYGNKFTGTIPFELGLLSELVTLHVSRNFLEGTIPPHLGNFSSLQLLSLSNNNLSGNIPISLGQLRRLEILNLGGNMLSGTIPRSIYNISSLNTISVYENKLEGSLPHDIGYMLPNLLRVIMWGNDLSGRIPISFSNASKLLMFELSLNKFFGGVPDIFGNLKNLNWLSMADTDLGSGKADDLTFFNSLTNCSNLRVINLWFSNFGGKFSNSLGNLSSKLEVIHVGENQIFGNIPSSIGNLISLNILDMYHNRFTGSIPTTIGSLHSLQEVNFHQNELSGEIPSSFGNLTLLSKLFLEENHFRGTIPESLGNCTKLLFLNLGSNALSGTIPSTVIGLSSLSMSLNMSRNHLNGSLPWEVGNMKKLSSLDVSHNELSGHIPTTLGDCTSLRWLSMGNNLFEGTIPESLGSLKAIETIDLSHNNLSGHIPSDLSKLTFLTKLSLSYNDLKGEVPIGGVFSNVSANVSVVGNDKLCGGIPELHLPACFKQDRSRKPLSLASKLIIATVCGLFGVSLVLYILIRFWLKKNRSQPLQSLLNSPFMGTSFGELLKATDGFSPMNLIGVGSFGSVYKGTLATDETPIAVKVFNLEKRGASKSFMAECETLRNVRHRNLLKIITACSSVDYQGNDFKALVYEFMPNGTLEDWLHPLSETNSEDKKSLTLCQRLNMVIDVGSALDYLHNHSESPIVHCDLKPSNILLDRDMTAHVGDFGLSRILSEHIDEISQNNTSTIGLKGTVGYAAPEYGMGSKVSTKGDVYSFGILILEILTGKRPTDGCFGAELNLNQFVKTALPEKVVEIVDLDLIPRNEEERASSSNTVVQAKREKIIQCLRALLAIGVMCSEEAPNARMNINDALKELQAVKNLLLEDGRISYRA